MDIIFGLLFLCALVVIHEAGHTLAALASGVGVRKFSIGFGPGIVLWRTKTFPVVFAPILLGGYVKLKSKSEENNLREQAKKLREAGRDNEAEKLEAEAAQYAASPGKYLDSNEVSYLKKIFIFSAGVGANLVSAVIFRLILFVYAPDIVVRIGFMNIRFVAGPEEWYLLPVEAVVLTAKSFYLHLKLIIMAFPVILMRVIQVNPMPGGGMIGTVGLGAAAVSSGLPAALGTAYLFSVALAAFNILPLPPLLDGGHVLNATLKKIFGATRGAKIAKVVSSVFGTIFIVTLLLFMFGSDIADIIRAIR